MTDKQNQIPAIVLGGTGYVSGELLRLIVGHPNFTLAGVMSDSSPGELAGKSFPHLAGVLGNTAFKSQAEKVLNSMDVVQREEFEAVREMAVKARAENKALSARLEKLEAMLAGEPAAAAAPPKPRAKK